VQTNAVHAAVAVLRSAYDTLATCDVTTLTRDDLLDVMDALEVLGCQLPMQRHRLLARLQAESNPKELGAKTWRDLLMVRWRLSSGEAHRRLSETALLAPRQALSRRPLEPVLAGTPAAQSSALITSEHVEVIRKGMNHLPGFVDTVTRAQVEVDWVRHAVRVGPKELGDNVVRTLFLLDQDGAAPDDAERAPGHRTNPRQLLPPPRNVAPTPR
jgi:hypothetical protein